jgi:predicted nucleic acid-binding protein
MSRRGVFLDASFWIGLRDEQDARNGRAATRTAELLAQRLHFVTTPLVFAETHAYFTRAPRRRQQILDDVEHNPIIQCEPLTPLEQTEAIHLLRRHKDKSYSFCDAVSFVVMRRLGLTRVATFDEHFRQFGGFEIIC